MSTLRSNTSRFSIFPLIALTILGLSLVTACGGTKERKVELKISRSGLNEVLNAAPRDDYALYVAADSVPSSAADLANYAVIQCTGDNEVNRGIQVGMGIQVGIGVSSTNINIGTGDSSAAGIEKALGGGESGGSKSLVLVKRGSEVPSDAVEVVLK